MFTPFNAFVFLFNWGFFFLFNWGNPCVPQGGTRVNRIYRTTVCANQYCVTEERRKLKSKERPQVSTATIGEDSWKEVPAQTPHRGIDSVCGKAIKPWTAINMFRQQTTKVFGGQIAGCLAGCWRSWSSSRGACKISGNQSHGCSQSSDNLPATCPQCLATCPPSLSLRRGGRGGRKFERHQVPLER